MGTGVPTRHGILRRRPFRVRSAFSNAEAPPNAEAQPTRLPLVSHLARRMGFARGSAVLRRPARRTMPKQAAFSPAEEASKWAGCAEEVGRGAGRAFGGLIGGQQGPVQSAFGPALVA